MARLFIDGFESGDLKLWDTVHTSNFVTTPIDGMTGSYCVSMPCCGARYLIKKLPAKSELYVAFKYCPDSLVYDGGLCEFLSGVTVLGRLTRNATTGLLVARRGTTILATGSIPLAGDVTYLIEVHYKPHDSTGAFQVKIGGILDINYSGDTTDSATSIDGFTLGSMSASYYPYAFFDDVVIDDAAWIGNTRIQGLVPTANGTANDMTPSAGSNYECVDEIPGSVDDYVYSNTAGHKDLYAMSDLSGDITAIKCLSVDPYAVGYGNPAPTQLKALVRVGSTNYQGSAKDVLTVTPKRSQHIWETNPSTGSAWTPADINGVEAGVELV